MTRPARLGPALPALPALPAADDPAPAHPDLQRPVPARLGHAAGVHLHFRGPWPELVGQQAGEGAVRNGHGLQEPVQQDHYRAQDGNAAVADRQSPDQQVPAGLQQRRRGRRGEPAGRGRAPVAALLADRARPHGPGVRRRRLAGRRAGAPAGARHHRGRPPGVRGEPRRAPGHEWPQRRAEGAGRHLRRHAGPAGRRVRQPAPVCGERLPRAAHAADRDAHRHRRHAGQARPDPVPSSRTWRPRSGRPWTGPRR